MFADACRAGRVDAVCNALRELMAQRAPLDVTCFNAVVGALAADGRNADVARMLDEMQRYGIRKSVITYNSQLSERQPAAC